MVAVGRVMATATEPLYSIRLGLQSVETMVSVEVVPVTALPEMPGKEAVIRVRALPEGVSVNTWGTPFGVVAGVTPLIVVDDPAAE